MAPRVMARHPAVQWVAHLDPGGALRLHLRVAGDRRRTAMLTVHPTAEVYLGQVAGVGTGPDFAEMGPEDVEEVFTDYVHRLCRALEGPCTLRYVWRGERMHAGFVQWEDSDVEQASEGELFGLRRRVLTRLGVHFTEQELRFPAVTGVSDWRPGDPVEAYPMDTPVGFWRGA